MRHDTHSTTDRWTFLLGGLAATVGILLVREARRTGVQATAAVARASSPAEVVA